MTERDTRETLVQMLEFADRVLRYTHSRTLEELQQDQTLRDVVEHNLTKLGEAARRIPEGERRLHPEIPWLDIAGMRNRLIHVYDEIDYVIVWRTVQIDLPRLVESLKQILR